MFIHPTLPDLFRHKYPDTNFHELNADWLIKTVSEMEIPEGSGCDCDLESIRRAIEKLQENDKIIIANMVLMQAEIDELKLPVMQLKDFVAYYKTYSAETDYKLYTLEAL